MNTPLHSFLYFIFLGTLFALVSSSHLYAQTKRDSLNQVLNTIRTSQEKLELVEGIRYLEQKEDFIEKEYPSSYKVYVYEAMANTYYKLGDLDSSEEYTIKGLSLIKSDTESDHTSIRIRLLCLLGILQKERQFYDLASQYYQQALQLSNTASDSLSILNNQATLFKEQDRYNKAIATYTLGLTLVPRLQKNSLYQKTKLLDNLGNTRSLAAGEGLSELTQALQLSSQLSNHIRSYSIHRHLTQYYLRKRDTASALPYATTMYELSNMISDKDYEKEALSLLLKLNQPQYGLRYVHLSDSLNTAQQAAENAYALLKYDKSEAEKEALAAKVGKQRILLFGVLILFVVLSVSLFLITKIRRKRKRAIQETEQRIAKHIHDDIANNIFLVMNKIQNTENNSVLDDLSAIYEQARRISRTHNPIDTQQPFQQVLLDLLQQYTTPQLKITPQNISTVSWNKVSAKKKAAVYKVLQELLTNTLKHSQASFVIVKFQHQKATLLIDYSDNGKGTDRKPSGGLLHAENRIRTISGTITFTSQPNHGFKAKIKV
ncbi:hypothetical protein [uncultured Marixanthomonas sp.]|uniref:tetratricopeptide repeat-containing sensor histidine kinase n=1 Tax=uncultured Marixanthomonas sp. TaxID=757245 RepID=UPI0030D84A40|tara:strand:- start:40742 stop:42379 length:1638 start_codon:yes stop_codon:yes gene_type:complete